MTAVSPTSTTPGSPAGDSVMSPELLRSLGRLVRGLSSLFWGLPLTLVVCVQSATGGWFRSLGILPPLAATAFLLFGLLQLGHFHRQERIWQHALDRTKLLALANLGFAPFLFWWNQMPGHPFFRLVVALMAVSGLLFLLSLNPVLCRLTAMLPDETLRQETRAFTALNRFILVGTILVLTLYHLLARFEILPGPLSPLHILQERAGLWVSLFLILMPMAMTMALLWKVKEVILHSVFGGDR